MAFRRRVTPIRTRAETLRWGKRQGLGESSHSFHPCGAASARPSRRLSGLSTARIGWTEGHAGAGSNRRGCPGPEFAVLSPLRQLRTAAPRRSERRLPGRPFPRRPDQARGRESGAHRRPRNAWPQSGWSPQARRHRCARHNRPPLGVEVQLAERPSRPRRTGSRVTAGAARTARAADRATACGSTT
jgi:hypothetical protein